MSGRRRITLSDGIMRVVVAACLAYSAYVHVDLHSLYSHNKTSTLSEADLFLAQAVVASIAAALVLVVGRLPGWGLAFVVAAGSLAAVLVSRYWDIGAIGPIPSMYEPVWFTEKTRSALAEGLATFAALAGLAGALYSRPRRRVTVGA